MATSTQELARETWRPYFDELSRTLGTVGATVEVIGRDLGAQIEAERPSSPGSATTTATTRMVDRPRRIMVATSETPPEEMTIDVEDAEGNQTIVHVDRPPALPAS
jgi:hypothetical protein